MPTNETQEAREHQLIRIDTMKQAAKLLCWMCQEERFLDGYMHYWNPGDGSTQGKMCKVWNLWDEIRKAEKAGE